MNQKKARRDGDTGLKQAKKEGYMYLITRDGVERRLHSEEEGGRSGPDLGPEPDQFLLSTYLQQPREVIDGRPAGGQA